VQILDIVIFAFFTLLGCIRAYMHPQALSEIFDDFSETSYMGAIVIAWETIILGIVTFYADRGSAIYVAQAMYWIAVCASCFVAFIGIFFMYFRQKEHTMADINGSWFLSFIPLIVGSTVGGAISPHLPIKNAVVLIMTAFLMWAVGIGMSSVLLPIYFWRLMTAQLPARAAIVTTFVPVGPYGMGAYSIQQLSSDLARCISGGFTLDATIGSNEMSTRLIGEGIQWIGVIVALMCLGIASFWLVEACLSVGTKPPRSFSIGENHFQAQRSHADPIQRLLELCVSLWRLLKRMELAQYKSAKRGHERLGCDLHRSHTSAMAYVRHSDYVFWSVCPSAAQWLADRRQEFGKASSYMHQELMASCRRAKSKSSTIQKGKHRHPSSNKSDNRFKHNSHDLYKAIQHCLRFGWVTTGAPECFIVIQKTAGGASSREVQLSISLPSRGLITYRLYGRALSPDRPAASLANSSGSGVLRGSQRVGIWCCHVGADDSTRDPRSQ
jgi:tellurite resistance protein TehA-like permease